MVRKFFAAAAILPLLMGCAAFAQSAAYNMRPDQAALVNATCTKVMGLKPGEAYFADCQDSLAQSLARREAAYRMAANDEACRREGLAPGSAAFSTCMLDSKSASAGAALTPEPVAFSTEATQAGRSYYDVTNSVRFQRERYSCAQLGLMPNGGLFGECVASLEGALLPDSN